MHTHTYTHVVGELCPSTTQTEEESIIPVAALYDVQIIIRLITHATHSPFPSSGYQYILCISIVLSVSRNISPGYECMYSILHTHSRQCFSHTYTHTQNVDNGTQSLNHVCKRREGRREQDPKRTR